MNLAARAYRGGGDAGLTTRQGDREPALTRGVRIPARVAITRACRGGQSPAGAQIPHKPDKRTVRRSSLFHAGSPPEMEAGHHSRSQGIPTPVAGGLAGVGCVIKEEAWNPLIR